MRLELDPLRAQGLERVRQLEQLRLAIRTGPLERRPDPGPAYLQDRCSGAMVMNRLLPIARPLARSMVANGTSRPAAALASAWSSQARSPAGSMGRAIVQCQTGASKATRDRSSRWTSPSGSIRIRPPVRVTGVTQVCAVMG